jgi:hypothetical protein
MSNLQFNLKLKRFLLNFDFTALKKRQTQKHKSYIINFT